MATMFPYPAKKPGGCRFSGFPDYANHQDYGEEEVEVNDKDFQFWEMIREDPDVVTLSRVGMDKQKRCLLVREYYIPGKPYGGTWKKRYFLIKRNVMASFLALAVIEGHTSMEKYRQLMHRLDGLVPATGDSEIDGCPPLQMTQEKYSRMKQEKREKERKELEERKQRCADFWDKDVWKDDDCYLFFEGDEPILICHRKRYSFGYDGRSENTIIYGDGVKYLHMGFDVGAECRYLLKNPHGTTQSITGRQYDARLFCHLLFAAATSKSESLSIDEVEAMLDNQIMRSRHARVPAGMTVWQDDNRKLYFENRELIMKYKGERYTFSCHPNEPMAIILHEGKEVSLIHNAFYPDECKNFIENRDYTVSTITGRHHNAERFCRLLTTAVDCFYDCQIDEVENEMQMDLVREKGVNALQFDARDFVCEKVLYEGIPLLLGYFESALSREYNVGKIYSIAYGYPSRNKAEREFYLLTEQDYHEYKKWPEKRQWKDTTEASRFLHQNLEGKKQMLCNEFEKRPSIYKPSFTLGEISDFKKNDQPR